MDKEIATGVVHEIPNDMQAQLKGNEQLLEKWNALTPLARNEWICWVISVKKDETRKKHLERMAYDIVQGKKRPCCWPGCPHRG
ncbi:YdeI/OmpD-associated family protein [Vallitaleaceae bacterium 9-2]